MSISYTGNIPLGSHSPASDQPNMLNNTNAINNIIGIDHITFNAQAGDTSGQHKQITFNGLLTPAAPSDPKSVLYNAAGSVDDTHPELYWKNSVASFPISCIRAFGSFRAGTLENNFNCTSPSVAQPFVITVNPAGIVSGTRPVIIVSCPAQPQTVTYTWVAPVLTINTAAAVQIVDFLILQI